MALEQKLIGFVIKTQDLGEADQLLTFFSQQAGKLRVLSKGVKKMTSRLNSRLQPYCEIELIIAGNGGLSKVIGAETIKQYPQVMDSQTKLHAIMVIQELAFRGLADEQPNEVLFELYQQTLSELALADESEIMGLLARFMTKTLQALGLSPRLSSAELPGYLSAQEGGFIAESKHSDDYKVSDSAYRLYEQFYNSQTGFENSSEITHKELLKLLNWFAGYQLERELRAAQYFA